MSTFVPFLTNIRSSMSPSGSGTGNDVEQSNPLQPSSSMTPTMSSLVGQQKNELTDIPETVSWNSGDTKTEVIDNIANSSHLVPQIPTSLSLDQVNSIYKFSENF